MKRLEKLGIKVLKKDIRDSQFRNQNLDPAYLTFENRQKSGYQQNHYQNQSLASFLKMPMSDRTSEQDAQTTDEQSRVASERLSVPRFVQER